MKPSPPTPDEIEFLETLQYVSDTGLPKLSATSDEFYRACDKAAIGWGYGRIAEWLEEFYAGKVELQ